MARVNDHAFNNYCFQAPLNLKMEKQKSLCPIADNDQATDPTVTAATNFNPVVEVCQQIGDIDLGHILRVW